MSTNVIQCAWCDSDVSRKEAFRSAQGEICPECDQSRSKFDAEGKDLFEVESQRASQTSLSDILGGIGILTGLFPFPTYLLGYTTLATVLIVAGSALVLLGKGLN